MKNYLSALKFCFENGDFVKSRAGNVKKAFGYQMRFDLEDGFPAVTTKKLAWKAVVSELLWFLEGSNDERRLAEIRFSKNREELTDLNKYSTICLFWTSRETYITKKPTKCWPASSADI